MFGWLRRIRVQLYWLRRRAIQRLFFPWGRRDENRGIFWFRNRDHGDDWSALDPDRVIGEMEKAAGDEWGAMFDFLAEPIPALPADATDEQKAKAEETRKRRQYAGLKLAESALTAFGVNDFNPRTRRGLTITERIALLRDFLTWLYDRAAAARHAEQQAAAAAKVTTK